MIPEYLLSDISNSVLDAFEDWINSGFSDMPDSDQLDLDQIELILDDNDYPF